MQYGINIVVLFNQYKCTMLVVDYELVLCAFVDFSCFFSSSLCTLTFLLNLISISCLFSLFVRIWSNMEGHHHTGDGKGLKCDKSFKQVIFAFVIVTINSRFKNDFTTKNMENIKGTICWDQEDKRAKWCQMGWSNWDNHSRSHRGLYIHQGKMPISFWTLHNCWPKFTYVCSCWLVIEEKRA